MSSPFSEEQRERASEVREALLHAFVWCNTAQGFEWWDRVDDALIAIMTGAERVHGLGGDAAGRRAAAQAERVRRAGGKTRGQVDCDPPQEESAPAPKVNANFEPATRHVIAGTVFIEVAGRVLRMADGGRLNDMTAEGVVGFATGAREAVGNASDPLGLGRYDLRFK